MLQPYIGRPHSRSTLYRETALSVYIDDEEIARISRFFPYLLWFQNYSHVYCEFSLNLNRL